LEQGGHRGIARVLSSRCAYYARDDAWIFEKPEDFFKKRRGRNTLEELKSSRGTMWTFEPHVAEDILFAMLNESKIPVYFSNGWPA